MYVCILATADWELFLMYGGVLKIPKKKIYWHNNELS